jgi:hypothetical protein
MIRTEVIQKILDRRKVPAYLEIRVNKGKNFFPIKARQKIAVDPSFNIARKRKLKWILKNPSNLSAKYYEITSDDYFENVKNNLQLDVVYIDGLHTFQQSLKDVNNSLKYISENGVIVLHDCNPPHEAAAYPADSIDQAAALNLPGWNGEWCGDVWKTICYLRASRKDLKIIVLDCDYGLGIITRGKAINDLNLKEEDLAVMTYDDLSRNRNELLNLKDESFFFEYLETI